MYLATKNVAVGQVAQPAKGQKKSESPDSAFADIFAGQSAQAQNVAANKTETAKNKFAAGAKNAQKDTKTPDDFADAKNVKRDDPKDVAKTGEPEDDKDATVKSNAYLALLMMQPQAEPEPIEAGAQQEPDQHGDLNVLEGLNVQAGQQQTDQADPAAVTPTGDAEEMARKPEVIIPLEGIEHEAEAAPAERRVNPSPLENVQKPNEARAEENPEAAGPQLAAPLNEDGQAKNNTDRDPSFSGGDQGPQMAIPTFSFDVARTDFEVPAAPQLPPQLAESAISQTIETIAMGVRNGQQVVSIQMKPEFLGRLEIQLLMGSDGLTARIRTSDPAVQSTIASQINQMQAELKDKGIQVVEVEVLLNTQQEFMDDQQGSQQQFQQGKARYARVGAVEAQITPISGYGEELQVENLTGSVNFTA